MLLGVALTKQVKGKEGSLFVEWHKCDKCGAEYRVYLNSVAAVEEAFQQFAKMFKNRAEHTDLCQECQTGVISSQPMMPMGV